MSDGGRKHRPRWCVAVSDCVLVRFRDALAVSHRISDGFHLRSVGDGAQKYLLSDPVPLSSVRNADRCPRPPTHQEEAFDDAHEDRGPIRSALRDVMLTLMPEVL